MCIVMRKLIWLLDLYWGFHMLLILSPRRHLPSRVPLANRDPHGMARFLERIVPPLDSSFKRRASASKNSKLDK